MLGSRTFFSVLAIISNVALYFTNILNMDRYLQVLIIVFSFLSGNIAKAQDQSEELLPQIKVVAVQLWTVNSVYFERFTIFLVKKNETFNDVYVDVIIKNDMPADIYLDIDVYVTDSEYKNSIFLLSDQISICNTNSTYNDLAINESVLPTAERNGDTCITKGKVIVGVSNNYRFDVRVPNIHEISDYHYANIAIRTANEIMINCTLYSEWGYL